MKRLVVTLLLLVVGIYTLSAQEYFRLETTCPSKAVRINVSEDNDTYLLVTDYCSESDHRTHLCIPGENSQLQILTTFEDELSDADCSTNEEWYVLFRTPEGYRLRLLDGVNVELDLPLDLPIEASVTKMHVTEDFLLLAYYKPFDGQFVIERFDLSVGQSLDQVTFFGVPFVSDYQAALLTNEGPYYYLGLSCAWKFRFDPLNLEDIEVFPLPIDDLTQEPFNPCSGDDVLYDHPDPDILFSASSRLAVGDELWTFYFNNDGEYIGYDGLDWLDDHHPYQYVFDPFGGRLITSLVPRSESANGTLDLMMHHVDAAQNIELTELYQTPDYEEVVAIGLLEDGVLHRLGFDAQSELAGDENALYIRFNANDLTGVEEGGISEYTFIQTESEFGIRCLEKQCYQRLYNLAGQCLFKGFKSELWEKSGFIPGTYVLRVETDTGVDSYMITVQ